MNLIARTSRATKGAVAAALIALSWASVAKAVPFESALPDDCIVYANVPSVSKLKGSFTQTNVWKLWNDPAMARFKAAITAEVGKIFAKVEEQVGVDVPEVLALPSGQMAFALRLDPTDPQKPPFVYFLADVAGNETKVEGLVGRLKTALEGQGLTKQEMGDITIFSKGAPKEREQLCMALRGSVLAFANDPAALKETLQALSEGMRGSLADNARFRQFRSRSGGIGDVEVFVDLAKIISFALQSGGPQAQVISGMLGLNAFQAAGVSGKIAYDDYEFTSQLMVLVQGQSLLLDLFRMPAKPLKPEPWVPASIVTYTSLNWDVDGFYNTLTQLVNGFQPGAMAQVDRALSQLDPQNPISLKNDIIGPLGNRITAISDLTERDNLPVQRFLIAWQLDDAGRFKAFFDRIMGQLGVVAGFQKKTVKGYDVYTFPLGDVLAAQMPPDQAPPVGMLGLTVTKTHFMVATFVEVLDMVLNFDGEAGLAETPGYQRVASKFPAETSIITYSQTEVQQRAVWQMLKSGKFAQVLTQAAQADDDVNEYVGGLIQALNGSNLPEFDAVKKYLSSPTGSYGIMDDKGIYFMQFQLR
ncbi:hypothetical protein Pan216_57640 [Planctomycetes bacterium Pan216]|uniref:DUF3352 domain-containing protein n=1 Tax=Kolteria novifilia TaxID=2527975 RepID=A0A518BD14_9BACT|nr:hypothetical protein Pan216_57640 [Planctomycetes bacterium Pan216]